MDRISTNFARKKVSSVAVFNNNAVNKNGGKDV